MLSSYKGSPSLLDHFQHHPERATEDTEAAQSWSMAHWMLCCLMVSIHSDFVSLRMHFIYVFIYLFIFAVTVFHFLLTKSAGAFHFLTMSIKVEVVYWATKTFFLMSQRMMWQFSCLWMNRDTYLWMNSKSHACQIQQVFALGWCVFTRSDRLHELLAGETEECVLWSAKYPPVPWDTKSDSPGSSVLGCVSLSHTNSNTRKIFTRETLGMHIQVK